VLGVDGQPTEGALVILTDLKSKEKWTFVTKSNGRYHFDELSFVVDYEMLARKGTDVSITKKLSQYDHSPAVTRNFELEKAAASATAATPTPAPAKDAKPAPKN